MTTYIGIGGMQGSGKDHCSRILENYLRNQGFSTYVTAFADHLKQQCSLATGYPLVNWWKGYKEKNTELSALRVVNCNDKEFICWCVDHLYSIDVPRSMRWWMQKYSDYQKSLYGNNVYIHYTCGNIKENVENSKIDFVIVTDVRYPAEIEALHTLSYVGANLDYNGPYWPFTSVYIYNPEVAKEQSGTEHNSEGISEAYFGNLIYNTNTTSDEAIIEQWKEILCV